MPHTATLCGRSCRANNSSVVISAAPSCSCSCAGLRASEPVATTKARACTRRPSPSSSRSGAAKRAPVCSRSLSARACSWRTLPCTSWSRICRASCHSCCGVACPLGRAARHCACGMPAGISWRKPSQRWAACSTALEGMQPTRAQVVPSGPWSISTARAPARRSVLYAFMPAVPAPMTATSTVMEEGAMCTLLVSGARCPHCAKPAARRPRCHAAVNAYCARSATTGGTGAVCGWGVCGASWLRRSDSMRCCRSRAQVRRSRPSAFSGAP